MFRFAAAVGLLLSCGGCAYFNAIVCTIDDADHALAADAPLKVKLCDDHKDAQLKHPGLETYCSHIPTSTAAALITWSAVIDSMITEKPQ